MPLACKSLKITHSRRRRLHLIQQQGFLPLRAPWWDTEQIIPLISSNSVARTHHCPKSVCALSCPDSLHWEMSFMTFDSELQTRITISRPDAPHASSSITGDIIFVPQVCLQTGHRLEHYLVFRTSAARTELLQPSMYALDPTSRAKELRGPVKCASWRNCITGDKFESSKLHPASSSNAVKDSISQYTALASCLACLPNTMMDSWNSETESQNKLFHNLLLIMVLYHTSITVTNTEAKKKSYLTLKTKVKRWHNTIKFLQTLNRGSPKTLDCFPRHTAFIPHPHPHKQLENKLLYLTVKLINHRMKKPGLITRTPIVLAIHRQVTALSSRPAQATERKLCQTDRQTDK